MLSRFSQHITRRLLATPLAIWGKLPSHGDFLRHRASACQARDWQEWVARTWRNGPVKQTYTARMRARQTVMGEAGWLTLEPRRPAVDLGAVPVAFVMQPGVMPFSPNHCVQGVMVASQDQIGRAFPLVVFQQITSGWLLRTWAGKPGPSQHDMLYWLARILARTHSANKDWDALTQTVDRVWHSQKPGLRHLLGAPLAMPPRTDLEDVLHGYCANTSADSAQGLHGVQHMPWSHWPAHSLRASQAAHSFWQQDMAGGYVNAGQSIAALWGVRT